MSGRKIEQGREPGLLPVAKLNGQEFLVDIENRQLRNFKNSNEVIWMRSQRRRKMLKDMQGSEWRNYGLSTATRDKAEV